MESSQREGSVVDGLYDVDFTTVWPLNVGTEGPEGGPDTALTTWHVGQVENEETLIPLSLTRQSGTGSASACHVGVVDVGGINLQVEVGGVIADYAVGNGCVLGNIASDKSVDKMQANGRWTILDKAVIWVRCARI